MIDGTRCQIQIDIGFGDAISPGPKDVDYPVMLAEFETPKLRAYPRYTVVAEKFEALTTLGIANSRMKDYFDLWILSCHTDFDGDILRQAVQETFSRRQTALTRQAPFGLTEAFAQDAQKQLQWKAFLRKNQLEALALSDVVSALAIFLKPVCEAVSTNTKLHASWQAGGPWSTVDQQWLP